MPGRWVQCAELSPKSAKPPTSFDGGTMSSSASLITLLASVAFGLIVLAVVVRLGPRTPS
jgi:hypothetical protein